MALIIPKLSILIATMPSREPQFMKLGRELIDQCDGYTNIQILWDSSMEYNIGKKRNCLLALAQGEYIVFIDDDDLIYSNYIKKILDAIDKGSDCIGISGIITTNGKDERQWHISKEHKVWHEQGNIYYRTPNHISPVKRILALQAGFPEIPFGEDYEYSRRLLPLLKTETIIKGNIYHYDYCSK